MMEATSEIYSLLLFVEGGHDEQLPGVQEVIERQGFLAQTTRTWQPLLVRT
jgi:hypothetical protein